MRKIFFLIISFILIICVNSQAQLMSNREIVRRAMFDRPDDLWPRGEGHIVLAIPGSLEHEKAYIEPGGNFSPAFGTFGITFWLSDKHDFKTWSVDMMPFHTLQQNFVDGKEPCLHTKDKDYELTHIVHSTNDFTILAKTLSETGRHLTLVIRSVGPAGGLIKKLAWDGKNLIVNDAWNITITPQPEFITMGDESLPGWKENRSHVEFFEAQNGWGYARMGIARECTLRITKNERSYRSPIVYNTLFSTLKIQLPDERFAASLNAQVANLMMGLVRDECRPGEPNNYPLPWLRDGAYTLAALARAGQIDAAKTLAMYFAKNDFFGGFGPEADAPGLAIWGIMQVAYEANDSEFNKEIFPHIKRKVELIQKMLAAKETIRMPITHPVLKFTRTKEDSNLVCEPARDGLIIGRMDWHRPILFVNSVSYSGFKHAAKLAEMLGQNNEAASWKKEADALQQAWCKAFDKECGNERTYICSFWPDRIAAPVKDKYIAKATENWNNIHDSAGDFKEKPLWTYFNFSDAHQWLYLQKPDYTWNTLEYFWDNQCSPGLYTWWEGNGEENTSGRWENVCGWVKPQHITPHYWTASEALALQLDMLAYYDESGKEPVLIIGEGIKKDWLTQPMKVEGIRLHGNIINWNWDGKVLKVQIRGNKMMVKAGSPFGVKTKVKVEYLK